MGVRSSGSKWNKCYCLFINVKNNSYVISYLNIKNVGKSCKISYRILEKHKHGLLFRLFMWPDEYKK